MSAQKVNQTLVEALERRQQRTQQALGYVMQTKELFEAFGSQELKTIHGRFDNLIKGLESSQVRLVVIGEFSNGKSSLVNALLDIKLLPTARQSTTAINTFIHTLSEGHSKPYLEIFYKDKNRASEKLDWDNDDVLIKWGTELDPTHKDIREHVQRIHGFTNHHLLDKGVILIDTPGLQTIHKHHFDITLEAIDQAHIAIWVQNVDALGGKNTEWIFLKNTIRKNFRKFITVINKWDLLFTKPDEQDKNKTVTTIEREKLDIVKRNFRAELTDVSPEELAILTSGDNLMGVSAEWGGDNDPERRQLSHIDKLAERIADLCTGEEALEEIIRKPLQALSAIQTTLAEGIDGTIKLFNSSQNIEERKRELDQLDLEIKNIEIEQRVVKNEAREEHNNAASHAAKEIQHELVAPLQQMKSVLEIYVTRDYVKKQIEKNSSAGGEKKLGLPERVQDEYDEVNHKVAKAWEQQKRDMEKILSDLRVAYQDAMREKVRGIQAVLDTMDIELPEIDITLNIDLGDIMEYQKKLYELQEKRKTYEQEMETLEQDMMQHKENPTKIALAKEAISRAERDLHNLGPQPAPLQKTRSKLVKEGGFYSDDEYRNVPYEDDSNVKDWKADKEKLRQILENKDSALQKVIEEEERKSGRRMTIERAKAKVEQEVARLQRELEKEQKQAEAEKSEMIDQLFQSLSRRTIGKIDDIISFLKDHALASVQKVFDDQLAMLNQCVEEQYMEPLRAKRNQREEVQASIEQGEAEVARKLAEFTEARARLARLSQMTTAELSA